MGALLLIKPGGTSREKRNEEQKVLGAIAGSAWKQNG